MNEREFAGFLRQLGIPEGKSFREKRELISLKMAEFQDSPQYMEDGAEEIQELFDSAMDYAEEMQKLQESGIMLDEEEEEGAPIPPQDPAAYDSGAENVYDINVLKNRTARVSNAADNVVEIEAPVQSAAAATGSGQGQGSSRSQQSTPTGGPSQPPKPAQWFKSVNGAANVDNLFIQAIDHITYDEWSQAERIIDLIISAEPRNPGAFLAKAFIDFGIKDIKELEFLDDSVVSFKDFAGNTNLRRARDYGDSLQSNEVTAYVNDNANYRKYLAADKDYQKSNNTDLNLVKSALSGFEAISGYRDADMRAAQLKALIAPLKEKKKEDEYNEAVRALNESIDKSDLEAAGKKLAALGDYKDAKELYRNCQDRIAAENKRQRTRNTIGSIKGGLLAAVVILLMLLIGPGTGDFIEPDHEGWFPAVDRVLHRFVPVSAFADKEKDIFGRVYLGTGELLVEGGKPGLPVFAPFAKNKGGKRVYSNDDKVTELIFDEDTSNDLQLSYLDNLGSLEIGGYAGDVSLLHLDKLEELTIPVVKEGGEEDELITTWYDSITIDSCRSMKKLNIRGCVYDDIVIRSCEGLEEVKIPGRIEYGELHITNCPNLKHIYMTESMAEVYNSGAEKMEIPEGMVIEVLK